VVSSPETVSTDPATLFGIVAALAGAVTVWPSWL
jgi:hypothetical protein